MAPTCWSGLPTSLSRSGGLWFWWCGRRPFTEGTCNLCSPLPPKERLFYHQFRPFITSLRPLPTSSTTPWARFWTASIFNISYSNAGKGDEGHTRIPNSRTRNRRTAEINNDHFDIRNSLFDILRFKVPTAKICGRMYMVLINRLIKK